MRNFIANFVGDLCGIESIGTTGPLLGFGLGGGAVGSAGRQTLPPAVI